MAGTIQVGCKLPYGIELRHPQDDAKTVTLAGLNASQIIGATHIVTDVDADFWGAWEAANKTSALLTSGSVFAGRNQAEIKAAARDHEGRKTGLEQSPQEPQRRGDPEPMAA